jgi:hypothetical protein
MRQHPSESLRARNETKPCIAAALLTSARAMLFDLAEPPTELPTRRILSCRPAGTFAGDIFRRSRQMLPKRLKIRSP